MAGCKTPMEKVIINDMHMDALIIPPGESYGPGTLVTYVDGKWWEFGSGGYWTVLGTASKIVGTEVSLKDDTYDYTSHRKISCKVKLDAKTKNNIIKAEIGSKAEYIKEIELSARNSTIQFYPEDILRSSFRKNVTNNPDSDIAKDIADYKKKGIKLYVTNYVLKTDFQYTAKTESGLDVTALLSSDVVKDLTLEIIGNVGAGGTTTITGNGLFYGFRKGNEKINVVYRSSDKSNKTKEIKIKGLYQIDEL